MGILNRYLCKEFLKLLLLFEFALFFVYFIVDFINKFGDFIEVDAPMDQAFAFFLYKIPFICVQVVPAAALLSVIVMFCSMEKNNEITAMKSSGMSVLQLSKPIIFLMPVQGATIYGMLWSKRKIGRVSMGETASGTKEKIPFITSGVLTLRRRSCGG
jgi:lipopolysaccharide export system permease protein